MINEFYKKVLPTEGVYCIATIKDRVKHYFVESIEEIEPQIEKLKSKEDVNIYIQIINENLLVIMMKLFQRIHWQRM